MRGADAAALWAVAFAAVGFYWAAGGTIGVETLSLWLLGGLLLILATVSFARRCR